MAGEHPSAGELAEYWTPDLPQADGERIEEHIFACAECARRLEAAAVLTRGISETVREGRFQATVSPALLNRLARDGARVRTYTLDPGDVVPCAVWADDELVAVRLRGDFTGLGAVTVVTRLGGGEEVARISDVPVRGRPGELIQALSAERLRQMPRTQVRLTVLGSRGGAATPEVVGEYVLEHAGALDRRA